MSQPLELRDDDFDADLDAPPGYVSTEGKHLFTVGVAIAAGVMFVAQMVLPQVITLYMMPEYSAFNAFNQQIPAVDKACGGDDRIWVPVTRMAVGANSQATLRALDLNSRWIPDSDITLATPPDAIVRDGDRFWLVSSGAVGLLRDRQVLTVYPRRALNRPSRPFLHDGQLCILDYVASADAWEWLTYRDGEWESQGAFAGPALRPPPPPGAAAPPVNPLPTSTGGRSVSITAISAQVVPTAEGWLVFVGDGAQLWRAALPPLRPLAELTAAAPAADDGPVSALAPLTSPDAVDAEWTSLGGFVGSDWVIVPVGDRLACVHKGGRAFQAKVTAAWVADKLPEFSQSDALALENFGIAAADGRTWVLLDSMNLGKVRLLSLTADGFLDHREDTRGGLLGMPLAEFWRYYGVITGLSFGLIGLFAAVVQFLMSKFRRRDYAFGHDRVRLASLFRRGAARGIDSVIVSAPSLPFSYWALDAFEPEKLLDELQSNPQQFFLRMGLLILGGLGYFLVMVILFGVLEGRYGCTPGKWCCSIRVVRTTFKPIGVLRGMVRQLLLLIDGQFNYLVGVLMIAYLLKCQRLGDLAADSIVVDVATLPENWRQR